MASKEGKTLIRNRSRKGSYFHFMGQNVRAMHIHLKQN